MALIKSIMLESGSDGNYWRLLECNDHAGRGSVVTLQLYKSKALRLADAQPLPLSLQFIFTLDEVEDTAPDENLPEGWRDVWYHCHYLLIKAAIASGAGKLPEDMTQNERLAQTLAGCVDDL